MRTLVLVAALAVAAAVPSFASHRSDLGIAGDAAEIRKIISDAPRPLQVAQLLGIRIAASPTGAVRRATPRKGTSSVAAEHRPLQQTVESAWTSLFRRNWTPSIDKWGKFDAVGMLTWLTERLRVRAAITLAAAYAFCVVFPPITFAFADGVLAAHCLTVDHHGPADAHGKGDGHAAAHVHGDGTVHTHAGDGGSTNNDDGQPSKHMGSCCGLFCFVAVTAEPNTFVGQPVLASAAVPACEEGLAGQGPGRIDRPPSTSFMSS